MRDTEMKEKIFHIIQIIKEKTFLFGKKAAKEYFPAAKARIILICDKGREFFKKKREHTTEWKGRIVVFVLQWWHLAAVVLFAFLVLYYPAGAFLTHHIDVDPDFSSSKPDDKGPALPRTLAALIKREITSHTYTPNKPFFHPSAVLDDMPAFQTGIITGVQNSVRILSVVNAQSETLTNAAERLMYPSDVWHIEEWKPAVSSVKRYKKAQNLLSAYQKGAAEETETYNRSAEAMRSIIEQIAQDTEYMTELLDDTVRFGAEKMWYSKADDRFYAVKGWAYVYLLVLRDLKKDFADAFADEKQENHRHKAEDFLRQAVLLRPVFVANGSPESQMVPNHLLNAGFYLSRAVSELKELENTMQAENE